DERTNWIMYPGEVRLFQCDGATLRSIVLNSFYKVLESSGAFIKPPGYSAFQGLLWGAGASGAKTGSETQAGGGGGGACVPLNLPSSLVAESVSVVIGSGGVGPSTASSGAVGGDSFFGSVGAFGGGGGSAS